MNHDKRKTGLESVGLGVIDANPLSAPLTIPTREALRTFGYALEEKIQILSPLSFDRLWEGVWELRARLMVIHLPYAGRVEDIAGELEGLIISKVLRTQAWHAMPQGDGPDAKGDGLYLGSWFTIAHYGVGLRGEEKESLFIRWTEIAAR